MQNSHSVVLLLIHENFEYTVCQSFPNLFGSRYPNYMELFVQGVQLWYHDPLVTIPVLKLFSELVQNRSQRLLFDVTSPNGVLLFREASKLIVTYLDRILSLTDIPEADLYRRKYPP